MTGRSFRSGALQFGFMYVGVVYGCECKQCSLPFPRPPPLRPPRKESSKDLEGFLFRGPLDRVLFAEWDLGCVCASGPVLGGCGVHGLYAPGRSGNIVGSFEPGLERESSRAGEPEGCNRIQNTSLRQRGRNEQVRCPEYALPQVRVPGISLLSIGLSTAVVVEER